MVSRLPLLILLLLLTTAVSRAATQGCLRCHPLHYSGEGSCCSCHRGDDRTDRKRIAHNGLIRARYAAFTLPGSDRVARGKRLLERFGCRRCHTADRQGTTLAASLDRLRGKSPEELAWAIDHPAMHMPRFRFAETERDDLVNYLLWLGRDIRGGGKETPLVIHFVGKEQDDEHPFVKRCGGCHKGLTESLGGLGRGAVGPNLSALFTPFYPRQYREGEPWNPQRLREWLKNPRKVRPLAVMPPVVPEQGEGERIAELLTVKGVNAGNTLPQPAAGNR